MDDISLEGKRVMSEPLHLDKEIMTMQIINYELLNATLHDMLHW